MKRLAKLLLPVIWLLMLSCDTSVTAQSDDDTGSGSEVVGRAEYSETAAMENGEAGLAKPARIQLALPVINAAVYLFPESFQADVDKDPAAYVPKVRTDSNGRFSIKNVLKGVWVLEVNNGNGASAGRRFTVTGGGEQVDLGTLKLGKPASLTYKIKTDLPGSAKIRYSLFVLGTRVCAKGTEDNLTARLDGIPAGPSHSIQFKLDFPFAWSKTFRNIRLTPEEVFNLEINLPSP